MKDQTDPTAIQFWGQCLLQSIQFNFLGWKMAIDFSLHIRMELQAFLQMQGKPLWPERCLISFVITQGLKKFPQTLSYPKTTMETLWWHADLIHHWIWITSTWFMLDQTKRWNFGIQNLLETGAKCYNTIKWIPFFLTISCKMQKVLFLKKMITNF